MLQPRNKAASPPPLGSAVLQLLDNAFFLPLIFQLVWLLRSRMRLRSRVWPVYHTLELTYRQMPEDFFVSVLVLPQQTLSLILPLLLMMSYVSMFDFLTKVKVLTFFLLVMSTISVLHFASFVVRSASTRSIY